MSQQTIARMNSQRESLTRAIGTLGLAERDSLSAREVFDLIASDFTDREVARLWVREVEAAHRGGGVHREIFGEADRRGIFDVEQAPERRLLAVVGTSRVAGSRADAAIPLVQEVVERGTLVAAVTPLDTRPHVKAFGERLN